MPAPDSPTVIVARFLRDNNYDQTLTTFLEETGLDPTTIDPKDGVNAFTLEDVLDEKRLYDLLLKSENKPTETEATVEWTIPSPSLPTTLTLPTDIRPSNVLSVSVFPLHLDLSSSTLTPTIVTTDALKNLHLFSASPPYHYLSTYTHTSPILSTTSPSPSTILMSTMTGSLLLLSVPTLTLLATSQPHTKHAVRILFDAPSNLIVSSSYDKSIVVSRLNLSLDPPSMVEQARLTLPTRPEAVVIIRDERLEGGEPILIFSREDSTHLYLHRLLGPELPLLHTVNLAPVDHGWTSFHAMSITPSPLNPLLLAIATSSIPSMKLHIIELSPFPSPSSDNLAFTENLAVFVQAPQSAYSTAVVVWRSDGSGVWVNADDGVVRGVQAGAGKIVERREACKGGEKVRCLWAGIVEGVEGVKGTQGREVLVTGGFDKRVMVWEVPRSGGERVNGEGGRVVEMR